jgi:plastocyanin
MKKGIISIVVIAISLLVNTSFAQEAKTIHLDQTKGQFTIQSLTLEAGTYIFDIENKDVDHEVGFVLAPKGMTDAAHHIKAAYVTETVKKGKVSSSSEVKLTKGEYVYFCPMNPTEEYSLTVK